MTMRVDGNRVSDEWGVVLLAARRDGVRFKVNDGQRTMGEQQQRVNDQGVYHPTRNPHGAARPSPTAPHIKRGRIDHALDIDTFNPPDGADKFDEWCTKQGFPLDNTVSTEDWHKEIRGGEHALRALAKKVARHDKRPIIHKGSEPSEGIQRLQVLLRRAGYLRADWSAHQKYTITVRRAVRALQARKGIKVDGVVGLSTWKALERAAR